MGQDQFLISYIQEFHPEIASILGTGFSHNQEYEFITEEHAHFFTDENYYLILNLAYTSSGTTEDEIVYELGQRGVERLNELVSKGLILKNENGRYLGTCKKYKLSFSDTKERVRQALNYYKLSEAGAVNNWISFQTESLNDMGLKALKLLQQKHFNERKDQIFNNPMYMGDTKTYSATVSSTFLSYCEKGELQ